MKESRMAAAYLALYFLLGQHAGIAWGVIECYHCLWMDDIEDPAISLPECRPRFNPVRVGKNKCPLGCMTALLYGTNNGNVSEKTLQGTKNVRVVLNSSSSVSQGQIRGSMSFMNKDSSLYRGCSKEQIHPSLESKCRDISLKDEDHYKFKRVCYCSTNLCNDHFAIIAIPSSGAERNKSWNRLYTVWVASVATTILVGKVLEFHSAM